jgi:WD40 repeat protein
MASFSVGRLEVKKMAPTLFRDRAAAAPAAAVPYERFRTLATLEVGHSHLSQLDLSTDERRLLAVSESEAQLRVYDAESRRLLARVPVLGYEKFGSGEFLFWPAPGQTELVLFAGAAGVSLLDPTGSAGALVLTHEGAESLKFQSGLVGTSKRQGSGHASVLTLYEPDDSPALVSVLSVAASERVDDWVLSTDRTKLGVIYYPSFEIEWIDLRARKLLWRARASEYAHSLDLSPDGALLAAGGSELRVFSVADPLLVRAFARFDNNIHQVHFAPAGDAVAASSYDGHLRIVGVTNDAAPLTLRKALRHTGTANVYAFRFTRDGRRLYSCSGDRSVRVFGL